MPSLVPNALVERVLRQILIDAGYDLTDPRRNGETGVDIIATRNGESIHIECIGYKTQPPARAKDFYESFFRVVSRLNDGAARLAIALAAQARRGLPARALQHRVAWMRIADAFPELEIWLVDTVAETLSTHTWREWLPALETSTSPRRSEIARGAQASFRTDTLRGRVRQRFALGEDPYWDLARTALEVEAADDELAEEGLNPAPKLRFARLQAGSESRRYVLAWTKFAQFEWKPT